MFIHQIGNLIPRFDYTGIVELVLLMIMELLWLKLRAVDDIVQVFFRPGEKYRKQPIDRSLDLKELVVD